MNKETKKNFEVKKEILFFIFLIIFTIFLITMSKNSNLKNINTFFLKENKKYALYNEDGKKLTNYIFDSYSTISKGTYYVSKNGRYALINQKGKYVIDFKQCKFLSKIGDLYICRSDKKVAIYNYKGKKIYSLNEKYNIKRLDKKSDLYLITTLNKYIIINIDGKEIDSLKKINSKIIVFPAGIYKSKYQTIYYNKKTYIYDFNGKYRIKIDGQYRLATISNDNKKLLLISEDDIPRLYIYINGKIQGEISSVQCEKDTVKFIGDNVICKQEDKYQIYDSNGNLIQDNIEKYKDDQTFVVNNLEDTYNNKFVLNSRNNINKISGSELIHTSNLDDTIIVRVYKKNRYYYDIYNYNGIKQNKKAYSSVYNIKNNRYIVSDDSERYYLIDENAKNISKSYYNMELLNQKYILCKNGERYDVINLNGKVVVKNFDKIEAMYKNYLYVKEKGLYKLYNLENKKVLFLTRDKKPIKFYDNYFITDNTVTTYYYSYKTGRIFLKK